MQKDYFFSMIFNDERPDLASLLAGQITGHQINNFLYELGVQQIDLVGLPKDHKQTGNSRGLQTAAIAARVVRGDGGDTGDN